MKVEDLYAVSIKFWNWQKENAVYLTAAVCILCHMKQVDVPWLFTVYVKKAINFIGLHHVKSITTMEINYMKITCCLPWEWYFLEIIIQSWNNFVKSLKCKLSLEPHFTCTNGYTFVLESISFIAGNR